MTMSVSREQFQLHSSRPKKPVDKGFRSDLRLLAGAPGRSLAGAPGRSLSGSLSRKMAGESKKSDEDKCCPAHNAVVRKFFYPNSIAIRFPDNNRIPTVNVDFSSFSTLKVGTEMPASPYFLFLPSHNNGYFCVGGLTSGSVKRFLPYAVLPSSRDLTNYTFVRNLASRIGVRSGTVSSTNMALAGTFNACAFYTMRDFIAFDVSEFSTRCITASDFVQGVRSDNGVVLVSGPESVPPLRPLMTNELYSNDNSLNILTRYSGSFGTSWNSVVIYDYLNRSSDNFGPIIDDRVITFYIDSLGGAAGNSKSYIYYLEIQVTYASLKLDGSIDGLVDKHFYAVNGVSGDNNVSLNSVVTIKPKMGTKWISYMSLHFTGPNAADVVNLDIRTNIPMQFSLGSLGPGFVIACIGFNSGQEIVTDIARSIEAVPAGNLLPDKKADMSMYIKTKFKQIERAIIGFNSPGISTRRVYTRLDFYNFTMGLCGIMNTKVPSSVDLGSFNAEDRMMAGPISSIVGAVSPFLNLIPGIGPIAAGLGGVLGNVAGSLGFSGENPNLDSGPFTSLIPYKSNQDHDMSDGDSYQDLDYPDETPTGERFFHEFDPHIISQWLKENPYSDLPVGFAIDMNDQHGINFDKCDISIEEDDHVPEGQYTLSEVLDEINSLLGDYKTAQRYALALMGAPILTEAFTISNVVGIDPSGIANVEVLIIGDAPVQSYDGEGNNYDTPYRYVEIQLSDPIVLEAVGFYVSEDFQPHIRGNDVEAALHVIGAALIYSGRAKARTIQYVTLPKPGLAAGPSLGISAAIQCLGIIDTYNVFSGGFTIRAGIPTLTKISGTLLKTTETSKLKMSLICSGEESINKLLNQGAERPDGSVAFPYVSASNIPSGIPVNSVHAIVVFTILEALSIGHTLNVSRGILSATPTELRARGEETLAKRNKHEGDIKAANGAGRFLVPENFAKLYGLSKTPLASELDNVSFVEDAEHAIDNLTNPSAVTNLRSLLTRTLERLEKGDNLGAYSGLEALASNIVSRKKKDSAKVGVTKSSAGYRVANTISERLAGRSRKRKSGETSTAPTAHLSGPKISFTKPKGLGGMTSEQASMEEEVPTTSVGGFLSRMNPFGSRPVSQTPELTRRVNVKGTAGTGQDLGVFRLRKK